MWFDERVFYQIYPLGFCGCERENDYTLHHRFQIIEDHIAHMKDIGVGAVLFNPLFESERHGYDTVDFFKVDSRLGTNEEFKALVDKLHANDIKVVLDGVFNHVGRKFFAFEDIKQKREASRYKDWFNVWFDGNSSYNDGFGYEGWEGHQELVKLNLSNPDCLNHITEAIRYYINEFDIDGLRLDVCYLLPEWFLRYLREETSKLKSDFFLVGEVIHCQNFSQHISSQKLDSITGYECFKGMVSSINTNNLFEIEYSLTRLFSSVDWALMRGKNLLNFVDNHDVIRAYTAISDKRNILNLYSLLYTIPGIPCIYYGSEFGADGDKSDNDYNLRPFIGDIAMDKCPELTEHIKKLSLIRSENKVLSYGDYSKCVLNNKYMVFKRNFEDHSIFFAINIGEESVSVYVDNGEGVDLITGNQESLSNLTIDPFSSKIIYR